MYTICSSIQRLLSHLGVLFVNLLLGLEICEKSFKISPELQVTYEAPPLTLGGHAPSGNVTENDSSRKNNAKIFYIK